MNEDHVNYTLSGFASGEACFYAGIIDDMYITQWFIIGLKANAFNELILTDFQRALECGSVRRLKSNIDTELYSYPEYKTVRFQVSVLADIVEKVIPFFEKYPPIGEKKRDFETWKEIALIRYKGLNKHQFDEVKKLVKKLRIDRKS